MRILITFLFVLLFPTLAWSQPALVFPKEGKNDGGFNFLAYQGAEAWKQAHNQDYTEISVTSEGAREQILIRLAKRGNNPIVSIGFIGASAIIKVAPLFPKIQFYIIDMVVNGQPNVQSVVFRDHEGSFLVGALAALKSRSHKIGFVGGMDVPLIRRFACGYNQGAKYADPNVEIIENMTGTTPTAWNNPTKGAELTRAQVDRGVDVIFAAAGATSYGVYQAAKDTGIYAIGVDSNQNSLHPGTMLTSMVKRVDVAVRQSFEYDTTDNEVSSYVSDLGLLEGGVDWALDSYNQDLITPAMQDKIKSIKKQIMAGKIKVTNYMDHNTCS